MRVGVVNQETWGFFNEIYSELQKIHATSVFKPRNVRLPFFEGRVNQFLHRYDVQNFLRSNDVVFFEWASELLAFASHLTQTGRIVTRLHRYEMYQFIEEINWNAVQRVILVSQAKKREFCELKPDHTHKVVVIPEAISLSKYQPNNKVFSGDLGILCHLTPRKRVYELILLFYDLLQQRDNFHLHIGGGKHILFGDYYHSLHHLVKRLGLQEKVTFYGNVTDSQVWYKNIDIFISNSYSEGLQVSPMEAIASGCYCLSHDWDGADELLPIEDICSTDRQMIEKILTFTDLSAQARGERRDNQLAIVHDRFDVAQTSIQIRQLIEEIGSN